MARYTLKFTEMRPSYDDFNGKFMGYRPLSRSHSFDAMSDIDAVAKAKLYHESRHNERKTWGEQDQDFLLIEERPIERFTEEMKRFETASDSD